MSTYTKSTKHPDTGEWEDATWMDDYFGNHNYGVRFSDGSIFDPRDTELETRNVPAVSVEIEQAGAHTATITKHPDGRQDVKIDVTRLDIEEDDELSMEAKEVIEKDVLPRIQASMVHVVIIHKPSNDSASFDCTLPQVRHRAEQVINHHLKAIIKKAGLPEGVDFEAPDKGEYAIIEVHHDTYLTRVSSLEKL